MIFYLLLTWSAITNAQDYLYFDGSMFNFEDTTQFNHILINHPDTWKIMKPEKEILFFPDNAIYLGDYGIITDTNQYYSPGIHASFQFKLWPSGGYNLYYISFWHKYDFNPNVDGGIIETSWDYGETWQNIMFDSIIQPRLDSSGNMYSLLDTISSFDNQPGFTGLNESGKRSGIGFWTPYDLLHEGTIDTLLLRFTFKSGDIESNHEGWLLDDFIFHGGTFNNIEEAISTKSITVYPNPANDRINIKHENEIVNHIRIYSLTGQIIKETNQSEFSVYDMKPGIYIIQVNEIHTEKLIIK